MWVEKQGKEQSLTLDDILIVAPYNAQVSAIARRLPRSRVGTVDKFQGQEAPVRFEGIVNWPVMYLFDPLLDAAS